MMNTIMQDRIYISEEVESSSPVKQRILIVTAPPLAETAKLD